MRIRDYDSGGKQSANHFSLERHLQSVHLDDLLQPVANGVLIKAAATRMASLLLELATLGTTLPKLTLLRASKLPRLLLATWLSILTSLLLTILASLGLSILTALWLAVLPALLLSILARLGLSILAGLWLAELPALLSILAPLGLAVLPTLLLSKLAALGLAILPGLLLSILAALGLPILATLRLSVLTTLLTRLTVR